MRGLDLAFGSALAKAARHQNGLKPFQPRGRIFAFEDLGIDPFGFHAGAVGHAAMGQRLGDRFVGVFQLRVFADDGHADLAFGIGQAVHHIFPARQVGAGRGRNAEGVQNGLVQPFTVIGKGGIIDRLQVGRCNDGLFADIAEQGDLFTLTVGNGVFGAQQQHIGGNADRPQLLDRMLCGLCLQLARCGDIGQQRQVHEDALAARAVLGELADRLEERQTFDVAHGAADFTQHEIDLVIPDAQEILDLVGDVGNDLNGLAKVVAAPFLFENVGIDAPRGHAVGLARGHAGEAFVMAKIKVGLGPVIGDEHLAMLEGRHRSGVDVQVGVQFAQPHGKAACLQQGPQRCRSKPFSKRGNHAACNKNITCHGRSRAWFRGGDSRIGNRRITGVER